MRSPELDPKARRQIAQSCNTFVEREKSDQSGSAQEA